MNRKKFIKNTSLGLLTASFGIHKPAYAYEGKSSNENTDNTTLKNIKVTDVKTYRFKKATFVKVETNEGISGWGESDGSNRVFTPQYIKKALAQYVIGKNPFNSEQIWHEAYMKGMETGTSGLHPGSLSGIDNALWDLKGKILDMPVHQLLGGNGLEKIRVYGSYGRSKGGNDYYTPKEMAKKAAAFVEKGYKAVKARMQIRQENVNPYPDDIYDVVKEVRAAIGDDIKLFVDFNNGYTPAEATVLARRLADDFNLAALEEPVFQQDYAGLRQVVDALDIPVMAGEHEYNAWMVKDLITIANVDVINADVIKCGGISECKKAAALAHAFGKQIMVHNAKPTLATAASLNLLASIPNGARFQEYAGKRTDQGYGPLLDLFDNYFEFEDGYLIVPQTSGLGLQVNEQAMEKNKLD